jgi:prepilin-type N-terminal cleavage/methylation domain-containing protein
MKRRGFTLWESLVALFVLSVLTTICLQFFAAETEQRQQLFAHLAATQEAANLLERTETLDWNGLTSSNTAKVTLSAEAQKAMPEPRAEILVNEPTGSPLAKRVTVAVHWRPKRGGAERAVRLVAWRYKKP